MRQRPFLMQVVVCALTAGYCLVTAAPVHAQQATTPQFFFALPGQTPTSYTQGATTTTVGQGQTFILSVWYQYQPTFSFTYTDINVFVGFDQTTSYGSGATAQTGRISFASGQNQNSAISNVNSQLVNLQPNGLGGGRDPIGQASGASRPYGIDASFEAGNGVSGFSGTGSTPVHLFDVTLKNASIPVGGSQQLSLYTSGDPTGATDYDTFLTDGTRTVLPDQSYNFSLIGGAATVPEPGTVALFTVGSVALLFAGRRLRA